MIIAVLATSQATRQLPLNLHLAAQVIVGAAAYGTMAAIFYRANVAALIARVGGRRARVV
jgi:hypothetical protein